MSKNNNEVAALSLKIAKNLEKEKAIPVKLVIASFFLSMLVTNDITLMVIVFALIFDRKALLVDYALLFSL